MTDRNLSKDDLQLPSSKAAEHDETSPPSTLQSSSLQSRTCNPVVPVPTSAPEQTSGAAPQSDASLTDTLHNPVLTRRPNSHRRRAPTVASLNAEIFTLKARIAYLETENVRIKEAHRKIDAENDSLIETGNKLMDLGDRFAFKLRDREEKLEDFQSKAMELNIAIAEEDGIVQYTKGAWYMRMANLDASSDGDTSSDGDASSEGEDSSGNDDSSDSDYYPSSDSDVSSDTGSGDDSDNDGMVPSFDEPAAKKLKRDHE